MPEFEHYYNKRPIAMAPGDHQCVVYLQDTPPYYTIEHLAALVLVVDNAGEWEVVPMCRSGSYYDSTDAYSNFHCLADDRDITEELRAAWAEEGSDRYGGPEEPDARAGGR